MTVLRLTDVAIVRDGRRILDGVTWSVADPRGSRRTTLVAVDMTTGERTTLFDDPGAECGAPVVSPDGTTVAFLRETLSMPEEPTDTVLVVVPLDGSAAPREVTAGWAYRHHRKWLKQLAGLRRKAPPRQNPAE